MVIAAGREERGAGTVLFHELEAKGVAVESDGAWEVRDLEMDVADARLGMDGRLSRCRACLLRMRRPWWCSLLAARRLRHGQWRQIGFDLRTTRLE